jgi:hypothetical protein
MKTKYQFIEGNTLVNESPMGNYRVETNLARDRRRQYMENAKKATHFGGKRFLGYTDTGTEFWVSFNLDLKTGELEMSKTHEFDALRREGAQLATCRVEVPRHKSKNVDVERMIRQNSRSAGGEITPVRVDYFDKLFSLYESKNPRAYVKGIPSSFFMTKVASSIFTGDLDNDLTSFTLYEAIKVANLPEGVYFNV